MQGNHRCCKHRESKAEKSSREKSTLSLAVLISLLPHLFCCFMPLIFTAVIGGAMALFFHDYWYVVSGIAALVATVTVYMLRNEQLSFIRVSGNVAIALCVAFVFNVILHPSHSKAQSDELHTSLGVAQGMHNHPHSHD